jgi:hypothetical protein
MAAMRSARCARRKEAGIFTVAIQEIDERGVIDGVFVGAGRRDFGIVDAKGGRRLANVGRIAGKSARRQD